MCEVTADYIETEAHFEGKHDGQKVYRPEGTGLQAARALEIVTKHLDELEGRTSSSANVQKIRRSLLDSCLSKAGNLPGVFTLTAPTGGGKTLAMLAFALKHAIAHPKMRRIVMVVPFLSIIEQTAADYRKLLEPHFGSTYILEHHSLADGTKKGVDQTEDRHGKVDEEHAARLLAENWDAPLILTTSVQFFESLFDNRPAACRKLHRLANSVVLFDEVQTLPPRIVVPSLAVLSRLAERYGCSVVFSTATQPAFDHLDDKVKEYTGRGWRPREIAGEPESLFGLANRVRIDWQIGKSRSWDSIADELALDENYLSLCVVNLKRHARDLVKRLRERLRESGLFHLSTNMCPAHRRNVLGEVRTRLYEGGDPCRLVSTQCVEAGVDVDFPVAWRAFGPLDSIAQVAGRCNREGKLKSKGRMIVFLPEKEHEGEHLYPPGGYKEATETTRTLFNLKVTEASEKEIPLENAFDICDPQLYVQYYRLLYDLTGATNIAPSLEDALQRRSFVDVALNYHIIDQGSINILVPYSEEITMFRSLKERLEDEGRMTRQWIHDARPLSVSLYRPKEGSAVWNYLSPVPLGKDERSEDWFVYLNEKDYDPLFGLEPPEEVGAWMV